MTKKEELETIPPVKDFFSWDEEVDGREIVVEEAPKTDKQIEVETMRSKWKESVIWWIKFLVPGKPKVIVQEQIAWEDATGKTVTIFRTEVEAPPEPAPHWSEGIVKRLRYSLHMKEEEKLELWTPYYILVVSFVDLLLFCVACAIEGEFGLHRPRAGPDQWQYRLVGAFPGCVDTRIQLWRWVLYQFCHVGWPHIFNNLLLQLIYGTTLEAMYGWKRLLIVYQSAVVAGGLTCSAVDVYRTVAGASAGVYGLLGMNLANLFLQRDNLKEGILPRMGVLFSLMAYEMLCFAYAKTADTSFAAHAGGFFWGFFMGLTVLRNFKNRIFEYVLAWFSFMVLVLFAFFMVSWTIDHNPPENWADEDTYGAQPNMPCCWQNLPFNNTVRQWYSCHRTCDTNEYQVTNVCEYILYFEGAPPNTFVNSIHG